MFMTDPDLIYGKNSDQLSEYTGSIHNIEAQEEAKKSSEIMKKTGAATVAAAKLTGKATIGAAKTAGNAAAKLTKNAADYLKSDDAAEKMNFLKGKAKSAASGAGSMLSGIRSKASGMIAEQRNKSNDEYTDADNIENIYSDQQYSSLSDTNYDENTVHHEEDVSEYENSQITENQSANSVVSSRQESPPEIKTSPNIPQFTPNPVSSGTPGYVIQKQKSNTVLIIVIIVLVLIIGVFGGMFFMMSRDKKQDATSKNASISDSEESKTNEEAATKTEIITESVTVETSTVTVAETTMTTVSATEPTENNDKTITAYPESDISKYPQYIKAAENDRDSSLADHFALVDINEDNIPELFLTDSNGMIYAVYTAIGDDYAELQHVGGSGRDWISLYNDGCISHGGAMGQEGGYADYVYSGGTELTMLQKYSLQEYEGIPDFHGGNVALSVSPLSKYITQNSGSNKDYTTYDTSAATPDFKFFDQPALGIIITQSDPLNLRSKPSTDGEIIIKMAQNAYCSIYGQNADWCYVSYTEDGITYYGYANRQFIGDGAI